MANYSNVDISSVNLNELKDVWVFGYGSILWNPGFNFASRHCGYIEGYVRRFWQGSTTHRGTSQMPGRVATLIQHEGACTWGMAFHVIGVSNVQACLHHLGLRECHLGGYEVRNVLFKNSDSQRLQPPAASVQSDGSTSVVAEDCIPAWAFVATPSNQNFLGPAPIDDLAVQVTAAVGFNGPNFEYVTKLADFVRNNIPQDTDQHLFELDSKIRQILTSIGTMPTPRDVKVNNHNNSGVADFVEGSTSRHVHEKNSGDKKTSSVLLNFVSSQTPVISIRAC